mgnify:CR=1 FL=1
MTMCGNIMIQIKELLLNINRVYLMMYKKNYKNKLSYINNFIVYETY